MLREILHDKNGHEYIVEGVMGFGRYTVCVNWEFWSVVDNKKSLMRRSNKLRDILRIDKRRKICYNHKREARNRLALICVLPGQAGIYRFKSLKIRKNFSL